MKILYDDQAFSFQRFGGVSRCFCELIDHLPADVNYEISIRECNNVHLLSRNIMDINPASGYDIAEWKKRFSFKGSGRIYKALNYCGLVHGLELENQRYSIEKIKEGDFDVFHATFFDDYFLKHIGNRPFVITVHDMIPELFPHYFPRNKGENRRKALLCQKAAAIIAVSEKTKEDLVRILGVPPSKVTVVYHGGPEKETISTPRIVNDPYILYVGQRNGYKNFIQTLADFSEFSKLHQDVKLICTGPVFTAQETSVMDRLYISDKVKHLRVNDEEMKNLYAYAIAFIYPSLYEGFGMPILEAYAYGCLTLLNDKSCFREIGGDAAIYFDSVEGKSNFVEKLEWVMRMTPEEKADYRQRGYDRLQQFSWDASARKLVEVYKSVI